MTGLMALIASLVLNTGASWLRMFIALFLSVIFSLAIGIYAARRKTAERIILPILDVFQTLPILTFFPLAIAFFVLILPGFIGINAAIVFLIFTSMTWNIAFAVYEAIKSLPNEFIELARLYDMGIIDQLRKIFIPAAMPRVVEQSVLSWSIGLFYLVTSEIFSTGTARYSASYGIGVMLTHLAASGNFIDYGIGIAVFIAFVIATRFLVFSPMEKYFMRYSASGAHGGRPPHALSSTSLIKALSDGGAKVKNALGKLALGAAGEKPRRVKRQKRYRMHTKAEQALAPTSGRASTIYGVVIGVVAILLLLYFSGLLNPSLPSNEYTTLLNLGASFVRVWVAFAVMVAIAIPVSVYLVFKTPHARAYLLAFQIFASIPATILLPVIVAGLSSVPAHSELIAFIVFFLSGIWYIIFSVIASTRTLRPEIFEVKKLFGIKGLKAWKNVYLGAIVPGLVTGSITAIAAEWNASIVAEYFTTSGISSSGASTMVLSSVHTGIGLFLDNALNTGNFPLMILALINLTVMILIINTFLWKRLYRNLAKIYG